jgi:hypothetical protein
MTAKPVIIISPIAVPKNLAFNSPEKTFFINADVRAPGHDITFLFQNLIIYPHVTIECRSLNVVCTGSFVNRGMIRAASQEIEAKEVYYLAGRTTTDPNNIVIDYNETDGGHYTEAEDADFESERIYRLFKRKRMTPIAMPCGLEESLSKRRKY